MIKIHIDGDSAGEIKCSGDCLDIAVELLFAINNIYFTIKQSDQPELAEAFRRIVVDAAGDSDSVVWTGPSSCDSSSVIIVGGGPNGG